MRARLLCILFACLPFTGIQGQDKPSAKARLIYNTLKAIDAGDRIFEKLIADPPRDTRKFDPGRFSHRLLLEDRRVDGCRMLTITGEKPAGEHILLLHGGAYIAEATKGHRGFMEKLALQQGFTVTFIAYPLAPENQAVITINLVTKAYLELLRLYPDDRFYLVGDSAGGGLALALLQVWREQGIDRMPGKSVLLSPWLDVSMQNPAIEDQIDRDVLLSFEGLKTCGELYAGGLSLDDPRVSPLRGDLNHLGNLKVFVSRDELFYPDCLLLKRKAEQATGTRLDLSIKNKMVHDWVILPIPERDQTIREIAAFLHRHNLP